MVLYLCIACDREVRPRQHAISCDICERWQHRLCDTGITLQEYTLARQDNQLQFICRPCEENYWSVAEQEPLPEPVPEPLPEIDTEPEPPTNPHSKD